MDIIESSFDALNGEFIRPLMVGSSGGAGHNSAIQGLYCYLQKKYGKNIAISQHRPTLYSSNSQHTMQHPVKRKINTGVRLMHAPVVGRAIKTIAELFYPILPDPKALGAEIDALDKKEKELRGGRFYIDMLLDVFPAGYESVAIWNILQRNEKVRELKKLIALQSEVDKNNYNEAVEFYYKKLVEAYDANQPYTEIISSQAMALPALCDAVIKYNKFIESKVDNRAPKVVIHEFVIELPTAGAVYYFQGLSQLTAEQQQQMRLYAVDMKQDFISFFTSKAPNFNGLYSIPRTDNPLVRPGFTDPQLDNSDKFDTDCQIRLADEVVYDIAGEEQIASIMLGSQAGNDTVEYIKSLLKSNMDRVFVFGGQNPKISEGIERIVNENPSYATKIVKLGNQGDKEIAALMSRSNVLVIRAGALSTQEQLAMRHNKLQSVFIHHADSKSKELTSGLAWEDSNANKLITILKEQKVHTEKTSPRRAYRHFAEARVIALAQSDKDHRWDSEELTQYIRLIPNRLLFSLVDMLADDKKADFYAKLSEYFESCEKIATTHVLSLSEYCKKGIKHIEKLKKKSGDEHVLQKKAPNLNDDNLEQSLQAINALLTILNSGDMSPSKRLRLFKAKYESKETQNHLLNSKDNFLQWILKKINAALAKVFPSMEEYFTFEQRIDKELNKLPIKYDNISSDKSNNISPC